MNFVKPTSISELKQLISEFFFNKTTKVNKIADNSVLNGMFFGAAKIGQKAMKDIALVEQHILPEAAFGPYLDDIARQRGVAPRFSASRSTTYVYLSADPGTQYLQSTHIFKSTSGIEFRLEQDVVIGSFGFTYAKVRSVDLSNKANVDPYSITSVSPQPTGHKYVINEAVASGGRDEEDDNLLCRRIQEGPNILGRGTLAYLTQVALRINPDVLKLIYQGYDTDGKLQIAVVTQNGESLNNTELQQLTNGISDYLSLSDLRPYAENYIGVKLKNIEFFPQDVSFRAKISGNPDEIRKRIAIAIANYFDPRYWLSSQKIEWDDLLVIVKTTRGIEYVADQHFYPNIDIRPPKNSIPRLRGFRLMDLQGNILLDLQGNLNPIYFPNKADFSFQQTVLAQL